jgi:hypothetical protein
MEQHTRVDGQSEPESLTIVESDVRRKFGCVVFTEKVHEKCGDILLTYANRLWLLKISLSTIAAGSLIPTILGKGTMWTVIVTAVVSTLLLLFNTLTQEGQDKESGAKHHATANQLWKIREDYQSLLTDMRAGLVGYAEVCERRQKLVDATAAAQANAPVTFERGYRAARTALNIAKEQSFSDDELDTLLPHELGRPS